MAGTALDREAVLDALGKLIETPSVNPSIAPAEANGEEAIARVAEAWLAKRGVRSWLEYAAPSRPNLVAEVGRGDGPTLVLCAHTDTVGTAGMTIDPFEPLVEGQRVYGRGSYDMKGSAAAAMCAVAALQEEELRGRVLLALVADEEYASIGAHDFIKRHPADACILTEPSEERLILAHKGFVWAEVVTSGRAAHGSRWDLGVSAIGQMGAILTAMERFDREELRRRVHPLVGPASQHSALIAGGSGLSTYSEKCTLRIERRTLPGERTEQVLQELAAVVRSSGEQAEIRLILDRPPLAADAQGKVAGCVRAAAARVTGRAPEETGVSYWMDAALFAAAGIPTVNYGPGGAGAHEAVEWVDLDSVESTARVLFSAAREFCESRGHSPRAGGGKVFGPSE